MSIIKQIKVFNGISWNTGDIGALATNVSLSSAIISSSITNVLTGINYLNNNKVSKSGDTMTGGLSIAGNSPLFKYLVLERPDIDPTIGQTIPTTSNVAIGGIHIRGKDSKRFFYSLAYKTTTDQTYTSFVTERYDAQNNNIRNGLYLRINSDGTREVTVTLAAPWRKALSVPSTAEVPPINHASSSTDYGIGTGSNYGHTKVINNLTTSTSANGQALNAYQGYLLSTKINALDHGFTANAIDTTTIANATDKSLGSLAIPSAGTYFIIGKVKFANNSTGRRAASITTVKDSSAASGINRTLAFCHAAANGDATQASIVGYNTFSAPTTIYLNVYHNSGGNLSISGGIYIYKIGI